jgi:hypothetical protein
MYDFKTIFYSFLKIYRYCTFQQEFKNAFNYGINYECKSSTGTLTN